MPAATYTITDVVGDRREWEGKFGKNYSYTVTLKDVDGVVELSQKPETPAPTVGQTLEGEVQPSNGNFPPRFKKAQRNQGGFGGGGGMSPEREKKIVRQHSQSMAIQLADAMNWTRDLPLTVDDPVAVGEFLNGPLKRLIDWFDKDAGI